jgi:Carboxylesterase family
MTADIVAKTAQGRLRGQRDGQALRFLGIPYAESPATAGRFAAPMPPRRWDGVRDALAYGATSPQPDRGITLIPEPVIAGDNELNLNVFTPDLGAADLPVLVWIHGGGFTGGCNASPWYRGGPFARDGVVLVSVNYRLGAEGFLELPDAPANRAVRDWVRALEWVRENIETFGGDPERVTIGGQSAGGAACATLLGVPAARRDGGRRPGPAPGPGHAHAPRPGPLRHRRRPRLGALRKRPQPGHDLRRALRGPREPARTGTGRLGSSFLTGTDGYQQAIHSDIRYHVLEIRSCRTGGVHAFRTGSRGPWAGRAPARCAGAGDHRPDLVREF